MSTTSFYDERRKDKVADRAEDRLDREADREADRKERAERAEEERKERAARAEEVRKERDAERRKAERRRAERKAAFAALRAKVEADTVGAVIVMACGIVPALYFQLYALNGQGLPAVISLCLAVMLEAGAWVATVSGERAKREGRPVGRFRAVMWACASFAALVNFTHAPPSPGGWLAWVLAVASFAGVFFWEVRGWGRAKASRSARTKAQRQEARRRRRHDRRRRRRFPKVHSRYMDILTAHPFGTIDNEKAWETAWRDEHGAELNTTARVVARRGYAGRALAAAHGVGVETLAVEQLLTDLFPPDGGDDGPAARRPRGGPNGGPNKGGRGVKTLGRKGKRATGRTSPKTPDKPLEAAHIAQVRALADILGGAAHLSVKNVRQAIGGGNFRYAMKLRDHVQAERKNR
ncbi:hypothetical protein ACFRKD_26890 [Streptomyces niveus]|uniref:hypothetical protein n=1 Tax=Streptomyces niveus TaxID=193462 RepID=UPI0036AA2D4E